MALNMQFNDGTSRNIYDDEQFFNVVEEKLGYDAAKYCRNMTETAVQTAAQEIQSNPMRYCNGECDRIQSVEGAYQGFLYDIVEMLEKIRDDEEERYKKPHCADQIGDVIKHIMDNL